MSLLEVICLVVVATLATYLTYALLYPEKFQ